MEYKTTLDRLDRFSPEERAWIQQALEYATLHHAPQRRIMGEPFIIHPVAVAQSLIDDFNADADTVVAGLLHDTVEDTDATLDDIERLFGKVVRHLVDGATEVGKGDGAPSIPDKVERAHKSRLKAYRYAETDPRLYLVKIADRWHNLKTGAAHRPKNQERIARETLDFHVPECRRLGFGAHADAIEGLAHRIIERVGRNPLAQ
jgi:GTP pyrophosphokinase